MYIYLKTFFTDKVLLKRFFFVLLGLLAFRLLASIPVPQIETSTLSSLLAQNQLLGVFNIFSGGGLSNVSVAMLGVFPYITVSIVVQLLTVVSARIHSLYHEEGEIGRRKITYWTRVVTAPVAAINAVGLLYFLQVQGVVPNLSTVDFVVSVLLVVAGSMLTMWIGELITEFGIGNGISFIVFAGIVVNIPLLVTQAISGYTSQAVVSYVFAAIGIVVGFLIAVWMNEADRPVPVTYARYGIGQSDSQRRVDTYIPIKVNPVGVLSIIFALTISAFFQYFGRIISGSSVEWISSVGNFLSEILANGYYYGIVAGLLTLFFTYFHAPIVFNTKKIADNIQKQGAFVPGLRPGEDTKEYFDVILKRVIFYSAIFLTIIAALPFLLTGSTSGTFLFAIGGTGALIVVSVVLDVYRKTSSRVNELIELG